ncbi:MAG: ABC transporter substrate binding protein [candidate division WOR-3 bacterium]|nr:ABC transporter substrate binding protein [candidate division WOR-3 bacterium]
MKKITVSVLLLMYIICLNGFTVYIVSSGESETTGEFIESFKSRAKFDFFTYNLQNDSNRLYNIIGRTIVSKPGAVLLLGDRTINDIAPNIDNVPLIISLYDNIPSRITQKDNVCGIKFGTGSSDIIDYFRTKLPSISKIGLIFNVDNSLASAKSFKESAEGKGLSVELGNIASSGDIKMTVKMFKASGIEAIWLGSDPFVLEESIFNEILKNAESEGIPLISLNGKYMRKGVTASIVFDISGLGEKAGELAIRLYNKETPEDIGFLSPSGLKFSYNKNLIEKYNLKTGN